MRRAWEFFSAIQSILMLRARKRCAYLPGAAAYPGGIESGWEADERVGANP